MINLEDDILEYSASLEKLQNENMALKETLRRYMIFGAPADFNNLESDLTSQLHESEMLLDSLFSNLVAPAFVASIIQSDDLSEIPTDFLFTRANPEFAKFYNTEIKDVIGKTNSELGIIDTSKCMDAILGCLKILGKRDITISENDDLYSLRIVAINHIDFFVQIKPVAQTSESERQVRENLKLTQMLVDAIPIPLFYKDMEGRYMLCNSSYCKTIIGMSQDTIVGKTAKELENLFPAEYAELYQEKDIELIKDRGIQVYEGPIKCYDGLVRQYIVSKTLIKDLRGNTVGILGVMQDIDKMIKTRRELAESEDRYKSLFNGISQPIMVVDLNGNIIMSNSAADELFDETANALTPEITEIPANKFVDLDSIRLVAETGEPIMRKLTVTVAGEERWYHSSLQLISDSFGERVIQIISTDVSDIKRYQNELLKQKNYAEESNNLKSIFLANIAHETRTPANIISGFVQMIQSGLHPEKTNDYLSAIFKNCKKLLDIVDDIVELSKIESGQVKVRHEICSINNIIEEAFVYLNDTHNESGKSLELLRTEKLNEYDALIYADNQYISQVFRKLISNAVTFTQKGTIQIGAEVGASDVTFFVKDTGIGIPEDKLTLIFERFRQADEGSSRQYGGNGLGLSIASELVKRMGGKLKVESVVNMGSKFSFSISYRRAGM